jgi:hypothetical protein
MGVHRKRLATSRAHRRFVEGAKMALQKWALEKLGQGSAADVGEALGYRGAVRFVEFGYSRATRQFVCSDGGDSLGVLRSSSIRSARRKYSKERNYPRICAHPWWASQS